MKIFIIKLLISIIILITLYYLYDNKDIFFLSTKYLILRISILYILPACLGIIYAWNFMNISKFKVIINTILLILLIIVVSNQNILILLDNDIISLVILSFFFFVNSFMNCYISKHL